MDFGRLARFIPRIEAELERFYAAEKRRAGPTFAPYLSDLQGFTLRGGKRFRALLVLAGYHLASGRDPSPVLPVAAALEHFQSWMLIHDDIIDHSEERRGGPTLHRTLARRHAELGLFGDAEAFGVGLGITLGDLEEPFTLSSMLKAKTTPQRREAAVREYVRMTRETALGQLLDIRNGGLPPSDVTEEDVLTVHRLKSAVYTVVSPLKLGAIYGGATKGLLDDLESAGTDLGVAFQLRDDVLGAGFLSGNIGKSANDLTEGKRTLLVVRAWPATDDAGRALLERVVGNSRATAA
ncbi:MAG: polyprenyl synthetase family protein, partial [Thermoplasmata archaeon]|nr:polyprenyl synthetase family protein [Thermoplasmata archaeon]